MSEGIDYDAIARTIFFDDDGNGHSSPEFIAAILRKAFPPAESAPEIERYVESRLKYHLELNMGLMTNLEAAEAEAKALKEALDSLVHLHHGINKGGETPISQDWEEALAEAESLLVHEAPKDRKAEKTVPMEMLKEIGAGRYADFDYRDTAARYGYTVTVSGEEEGQ